MYDPKPLWAFAIEPRLRWFFGQGSWLQPFGLAGAAVRAFDGYSVEDNDAIDYPDRPGGAHIGLQLGAGVVLQRDTGLRVIAEVPWTGWLNQQAYRLEQGTVTPSVESGEPASATLAFRLGVGYAF